MSDFPTSGIIVVIIAVMMGYLGRQAEKEPSFDAQGNPVLVLPKLYGVIGVISCALGLGVALYGLFNFDAQSIGPQLLIFVLFAGLGLPLVLMGYRYKLTINQVGLVQRNMLGKYKTVLWKDVRTTSFNAFTLELRIADEVKSIKCHAHLIGFKLLINELSTNTGRSRKEIGVPESF